MKYLGTPFEILKYILFPYLAQITFPTSLKANITYQLSDRFLEILIILLFVGFPFCRVFDQVSILLVGFLSCRYFVWRVSVLLVICL